MCIILLRCIREKNYAFGLQDFLYTNNIGFDGTGYHKYDFYHNYFESNLDKNISEIKFTKDKSMNFFEHLIISIKIGIFGWCAGFITMFFSKFRDK